MGTQKMSVTHAIETQKSHWESGNPLDIEQLLTAIESVRNEDDLLLDLIYNEVLIREELGDSPDAADYQARFPQVQEQISRQFQIHRAIAENDSTTFGEDDASSGSKRFDSVEESVPEIPGFEFREKLGIGGSGVAWRAFDQTLSRDVAIKLIVRRNALDGSTRHRFLREAESIAALNHAAIVPVFQVGECQQAPFLVMAFIDGGSLAVKLQKGPLPPRQAVRTMATIANAIQYAHESGIIHRDLKPGNILLNKADAPFVCDFGLARKLNDKQTLQGPGEIVGTPAYMPPEQAKGGKATELSDLYSLGVVLYEMLSGHSPFQAATPWESLNQVLGNDAVPLRQLNSSVPKDLETICQKCMEKSPASRYQSVSEFEAELNRFLDGQPVLARPLGVGARIVRWCRREPRLAGMVALAGLLAVGLTAAITIGALKIREANSESFAARETATSAKVATLVSAAPDAVPFAIESLDRSSAATIDLLQLKASDQQLDTRARLNAALGLASCSQFRPGLVSDSIADLPLEEGTCRNIVNYFRDHHTELTKLCLEKAKSGSPENRFRHAVVALFLGDASAANELARSAADPAPRITLIHQLRNWHGGYRQLAEILEGQLDPDLASALCAAVTRIDPRTINSVDRTSIIKALSALYEDSPHGSVHSAARSALLSWKAPIPRLSKQSTKNEGWLATPSGLTMIRIKAGTFMMGSDDPRVYMRRHRATIDQDFWMADREISVELFQSFMRDSSNESESRWQAEPVISPSPDCPAQNLTWVQAVRFCNWLSEQEGLEKAYFEIEPTEETNDESDVSGWRCDFTSGGYRLPTDMEWGYAAKATAETRFSFGDAPTLIPFHRHASNRQKVAALPCGSLIPNKFGLFDMEGNVWEWVWDPYFQESDKELAGVYGPDGGVAADLSADRVIRGGGVDNERGESSSESRGNYRPQSRAWNLGFRVARSAADN